MYSMKKQAYESMSLLLLVDFLSEVRTMGPKSPTRLFLFRHEPQVRTRPGHTLPSSVFSVHVRWDTAMTGGTHRRVGGRGWGWYPTPVLGPIDFILH